MANFDWFTKTEDLIVFCSQGFGQTFVLKIPDDMTPIDGASVLLTGPYTAKAYDANGDEVKTDIINILEDIEVTATVGTSEVYITGFFNPDILGVEIEALPTDDSTEAIAYNSFGSVPRGATIVKYTAPQTPAVLVDFAFEVTYGGSPGNSHVYIFVLVNYETLNQQFLSFF